VRPAARRDGDRDEDQRARARDDHAVTIARMTGIRLDHVVIAVSDWERANAFYRDVCGAELVRLEPPMRWRYRFGEQVLNVHGPGTEPAPVARRPGGPGSADLCLEWPGPIEEAAEHLRARGVAIEEGPVPRTGARGPGTSVYFRDPDGSLLEFISYGDA
jgi:catechol 2,3-dioxygenase-like lactoylglutathione lyase family enzyme